MDAFQALHLMEMNQLSWKLVSHWFESPSTQSNHVCSKNSSNIVSETVQNSIQVGVTKSHEWSVCHSSSFKGEI
jgi:hypothetical protein